jgi:hypothetical protein
MKYWGTNNTLTKHIAYWCWKIFQCRGDRLYFLFFDDGVATYKIKIIGFIMTWI